MLKMAVTMLEDAAPAQRATLRQEINTNIAELDALVEEVLLASRLDTAQDALLREPVEVPASFAFGDDEVIPLFAGEVVPWRVLP